MFGGQMKLDSQLSTTRCLIRTVPHISETVSPRLLRQIFPVHHPARKAEGGLRRNGYFKAGAVSDRNVEYIRYHPVVTVVTAVLNGEKYLEKSILSVLNQTYDNVEYIIIDGGSTDRTLDIIRKYEHAIDYWLSEPDEGIYDAWNKAVRLAGGEWIAFLGADDVYLEGALMAYINSINAYRNRPDYVSSRANLVSEKQLIRTVGYGWNWNTFKKYMNVAHVGSFHHRVLFEQYGLYDTTYRICGDYEFLLRSGPNLRAAFFNMITVNMGFGGKTDMSLESICETARARKTTGKRNILLSQLDKVVAIGKWQLRKWLWC